MSIRQYLEGDGAEKSLPESLYESIHEDILTKKFLNGSRLTEQSICDRYKVSRTPVREALSRLESEGLIRFEKNRGAFICGFTEADVRDLMELKKGAEIVAIQRAVISATKQDLAELDELFEFMEFYTDKNDIGRMTNINEAFHKMIYHLTHNRFLERQLDQYQLYIDELCPENYYAPNYLRDVLKEHRAIYDAIKKRDVQAGRSAILAHLENTEKRMIR
jgi:DNA-binding GntR family transcriptional regulator